MSLEGAAMRSGMQLRTAQGARPPPGLLQMSNLPVITELKQPAARAQTAGVGTRNAQTAKTANQTRAPSWRKTKAQRVDEKVEQLFESYRLIDQAAYAQKMAKNPQNWY